MDTLDAISKRASVREYDSKPVDKGLLEKLVDAGRRAPTARAVEPWEFVVVTDRGMLTKLGEIANTGTFIKDAASCIAVFSKDTKYYLEDGCAATENILLAAADLGLGACWVAGDKKPYVGEVAELLGASSDMKLISLISLGWPKAEARQAKHRGLEEVLHWEKF
jgi:nitroreductase